MLSYLARIVITLLFVWLVWRLLSAFIGFSRKAAPKKHSPAARNYMVKDPVCGMYMDSRLAVRLERGKDTLYFCSEECKQKYLNQQEKGSPGAKASGE